jgi:NAD(P)-dependent dehydrogenase (short-subunit alcohol dehydrogenase family)
MTTVFKTNTLGPLLTTQAFLPLLREGRKKQVRARRRCSTPRIVMQAAPDACMRAPRLSTYRPVWAPYSP